MKSPNRQRGFTLVELLLAMVVSSIILGAAYSSYLAAMQSWQKSLRRADHYQRARVALGMMEKYLKASVVPNSDAAIEFSGEDSFIEGTELGADILRFTTTGMSFSPDRPGGTDVAEVEFYLDIDTDLGEPTLKFRRRAFAGTDDNVFEPLEDELISNVVSFDLQYYDGIEFVPSWSKDTLPSAVNIRLTFFDYDADENMLTFERTVYLPGGAQ